ncbi:MAG: hypothetical protein R2745_11810 [Vicinamibacterales bacterium]
MAYLLTRQSVQLWTGAFYSIALVANYPHYMATVYRAYGARDRSAHRLYTVYLTAALVAAGVAAHVDRRLVPLLFTAYVTWSPWHYTGQNYGLLMMFLRRGGADVGPRERRALRAAFVASYVMLLATFQEGASPDPLVLSLGLPAWITRGVAGVAGAVFLAGGVRALWALRRRAPAGALTAPLVLYTTQAFWFVVPIAIAWLTSAPTPQARYSAGVLAVMHAAQYLWITQYFARREQGPAWSGTRYWTVVLLGGMALFLPVPWIASLGAGVDFTTSALIVASVVNLHHFMVDGVVWKLRDPRVARTLTATDPSANGASTLAGPAPWPRVAIVGAAVALVSLAGLDQSRYWLSLRESDPSALQAAARLNPYDEAVQGRLVQALVERGDLDHARAALDDAIRRAPRAAAARVNAGVLAQRQGRLDDAARHWRDAVALAPGDVQVRLYLAELLQGRGEAVEAAVHYRAYLEHVAATGGPAANDPATVAKVVLNFADALDASGHPDEARMNYELAVKVARSAGLEDLERTARARLAPAR